jgi:hypothetical protein
MVMVRFEGVPPGSPVARELYGMLQAPIDKFYCAQAQNYALSTSTMVGKSTDLGDVKMNYTNNMGQETVRVQVAAHIAAEAVRRVAPLEPPEPLQVPQLAIDIRFISPIGALKVGDVSSYEEVPVEDETHFKYSRTEYFYYPTLFAVGLRDDNAPDENFAFSTGQSQGMIQAIVSGEFATQELAGGSFLPPDVPLGVNTQVGVGFLISPLPTGEEEYQFGLYMASENIFVANAFPDALEPVTFGVDHPSFVYDFEPEANFTVRVRQFDFGADVSSVRVIKHLPRYEIYYVGPTSINPTPATLKQGDADMPDVRTALWGFAATDEWVEPTSGVGNDPPNAGLGTFLTSTATITKSVVGPASIGRFVPDTVVGGLGMEQMTRVATIIWKPPKDPLDQVVPPIGPPGDPGQGYAQITPD